MDITFSIINTRWQTPFITGGGGDRGRGAHRRPRRRPRSEEGGSGLLSGWRTSALTHESIPSWLMSGRLATHCFIPQGTDCYPSFGMKRNDTDSSIQREGSGAVRSHWAASAGEMWVLEPLRLFSISPPLSTTGTHSSDISCKTQPHLGFNSGLACFCLGSEWVFVPQCLALRQWCNWYLSKHSRVLEIHKRRPPSIYDDWCLCQQPDFIRNLARPPSCHVTCR